MQRAAICVYETQIFASHIPQLFIDCMIRVLGHFIFVVTGKMTSLKFDSPLQIKAEKVAMSITF